MDIQIRKQLEQLEYIKDKLEYIEYSESLQCYVEKLNGIPTGVAAWVNGAFYGFEQAAKAQAVPGWISVEDGLPPVDETVLVCWDYAPDIEPEKEYTTMDENLDEYWPNCQDEPPTHWMPLPRVVKAQESAFEAGAQSRQAEIDELRKRINDALLYAVSKYDDDGWLDGIELNRLIKTLK